MHLKVGKVDREVQAAVVPDSYICGPLVGMNIGVDEIYEAIGVARQAIKAEQDATIQAVQTRSQTKKEREAEKVAARTRKAEKPGIRKPEEVEPVVIQAEEVTEAGPGGAQEAEETEPGEPDTVAVDTSSAQEEGEQMVADVSDDVDVTQNVGLVVPVVEIGASLAAEYKNWMSPLRSGSCGRRNVRMGSGGSKVY